MNIAFFSDSYHPYTSGVVQSIDTFTQEFREAGHKVYIFSPNYPNCEKEEAVYRFFSVPSLVHQDFTLAIPFSVTLKNKLKELEIDIIHVHSPFLLGRLGAKMAKKLNLPLVFTYHTLYEQYVHYVPFAQNFSRQVVRKISKDFCNSCDLVVVPTEIIKDVICQYGVTSEIEVIPTGIDLKPYAQGNPNWLRERYNIPKDEQVLLFVGRLGVEKNIEFLLRAFEKVLQSFPSATLVLVGGGPQAETFKNLADKLKISHKVIFTGTMDHAQVIDAYLGADIFVFASITETQGLVIGEAQAAGLPVVAVEAFGAKEMVTSGVDGFLTPLELETFVAAILKLLREPDLKRRLGENARISVENISASNCARRMLARYRMLLENKNKAALRSISNF